MNESTHTFPKEARLHHRSLVERLFRDGKSFYEFPLRVTWNRLSPKDLSTNFCNRMPEGISALQMMVTVPKKKRRRAVDRVLMRRRIREAYRLNFRPLLAAARQKNEGGTFSVSFIYIHDRNLPYEIIEGKIRKSLKKLENIINQKGKE